MQHGRGVTLADFNRDGKMDIVYGNWNGPHRLYLQLGNNRKHRFKVWNTGLKTDSTYGTVVQAQVQGLIDRYKHNFSTGSSYRK